MSCATESYAPTKVGARPPLGLLAYSGSVARADATQSEIHHASPRLTAARVVPDTTKADPEHIWGDEGPINE
jgi:hypothetical protein